jgi:putative membrane protein
MRRVLIRIGVNAVALWVASEIVGDKFELEGELWQILLVAAVFGLVNAFLRPIAKLLSLPVIILSLGLFILVINAFMLLLTDLITGDLLEIDGFGRAFLGALIISIVSWALSVFVPDKTLWTE